MAGGFGHTFGGPGGSRVQHRTPRELSHRFPRKLTRMPNLSRKLRRHDTADEWYLSLLQRPQLCAQRAWCKRRRQREEARRRELMIARGRPLLMHRIGPWSLPGGWRCTFTSTRLALSQSRMASGVTRLFLSHLPGVRNTAIHCN